MMQSVACLVGLSMLLTQTAPLVAEMTALPEVRFSPARPACTTSLCLSELTVGPTLAHEGSRTTRNLRKALNRPVSLAAGTSTAAIPDSSIRSERQEEKRSWWSSPGGRALSVVLLTEGVFALNSYLAVLEPDVAGGLFLLSAPLAAAESETKADFWAAMTMTAGIGLYNLLEIDEDELSDGEIFRKNMVAWHVGGAVVATTAFLAERKRSSREREREDKKLALGYLPVPGGVGVSLRIRF